MSAPRLLTYHGEVLPRATVAARLGITPDALKKRLRTMPEHEALARGNQRPRRPNLPPPGRRRLPTLYCPRHEVAWWRGRGEEGWYPLPRGILATALAYAAAFECAREITVEVVACQACHAEGA